MLGALLPGFMPRVRHFFAKTCCDICKEGRSNVAEQLQRAACKRQDWRTLVLLQDPAQEGDVGRARLSVRLAAGPELPPASLCASGHAMWALGWVWRLLCPVPMEGSGCKAGPGRQPAAARLGRDFSWCSNAARDLHHLLE